MDVLTNQLEKHLEERQLWRGITYRPLLRARSTPTSLKQGVSLVRPVAEWLVPHDINLTQSNWG